jgi:hypothetical protein
MVSFQVLDDPPAPATQTQGVVTAVPRWIRVAEKAFAVVMVVLNFADIVTDIIVAIEFYQLGATTWYYLVLAFLLLNNIAVAIFGADSFRRKWSRCWSCGRLARYAMCILVGPWIPLILLVTHQPTNDDDVPRRARRRPAPLAGSVFMREEFDGVAGRRALCRHLLTNTGRSEHFRKYGAFYHASVTGSAPQAVIQLLAIAFLGRASYTQLISLCCSLFSIMSKAIIFAASYDVKVFVFSFLIVAHDVFSTFYLFSTVVAPETQKDTDFLGLPVSYLGYAWLVKVFVFAVFGLAVSFFMAAWETWLSAEHCGRHKSHVIWIMFGVAVIFVGPVLVLAECLRLSTYTLLRFVTETLLSGHRDPEGIAVLWEFLKQDIDGSRGRLRHVVTCIMATDGSQMKKQYRRFNDKFLLPNFKIFRFPYSFLDRMITRLEEEGEYDEAYASDVDLLARRPDRFFVPMWKHLKSLSPTDRLSYWDVEAWFKAFPFCLRFPNPQRPQFLVTRIQADLCLRDRSLRARYAAGYAGAALFAVGQMISFLYPFINASVNFHSHNLLQAVCFYGLCATLLLALPLVPATYRHQVFRWSVCSLPSCNFACETVMEWIRSFYTPSTAVALHVSVDSSVVPGDVMAAVVAPFVGGDIDLNFLSREDCCAVREKAVAMNIHHDVVMDEATYAALRFEFEVEEVLMTDYLMETRQAIV